MTAPARELFVFAAVHEKMLNKKTIFLYATLLCYNVNIYNDAFFRRKEEASIEAQ